MSVLAQYIIATTNLYGIVHKNKVVEIYNRQNGSHISTRDLEDFIENPSKETKNVFIGSKSDYFVNAVILVNDFFDSLLMKKTDKPYYIPGKQELLKYSDANYFERTKEYNALLKYVKKNFLENDYEKAEWLCQDIHSQCTFEIDMQLIFEAFIDRGISFEDMDQANEVLQLVTSVANNIRIWENNGHTPHEIFEKYEKPNMKPLPDKPFVYKGGEQTVVKGEKVGRNDPCPCGSGKKYKKCCLGKDLYH